MSVVTTTIKPGRKRKGRKKPAEPAFDPNARPIWEVIDELSREIPEEEWAKIPSDASVNLEHYLHGAPKVEP